MAGIATLLIMTCPFAVDVGIATKADRGKSRDGSATDGSGSGRDGRSVGTRSSMSRSAAPVTCDSFALAADYDAVGAAILLGDGNDGEPPALPRGGFAPVVAAGACGAKE
jgi:hypothetical protein